MRMLSFERNSTRTVFYVFSHLLGIRYVSASSFSSFKPTSSLSSSDSNCLAILSLPTCQEIFSNPIPNPNTTRQTSHLDPPPPPSAATPHPPHTPVLLHRHRSRGLKGGCNI